jgi:hypothetical protein
MNRKTDNEWLDDIFAAPENFREALLGETLRHVRRRRFRRTRNAAGIFIALTLFGVFILQKDLSRQPVSFVSAPVAETIQKNYRLIRTQPLPARDIVTTQPLVMKNMIASTAVVKMIQTTTGNYRVIDDDELLALIGSHPAVLVRAGKNSEELVFANPEDAKGFPLN